jgi:transcriptional regulator NrdR family protein
MDKQLRVVKVDGTSEAYLHTKVLGTINNALSGAGQPDMTTAEHLAEVVTFHLYQEADRHSINSGEIFSMIKAVLVVTGNEEAAAALSEHALERRLKRVRTEVLDVDVQDFADLEHVYEAQDPPARLPWDKTRIVDDLTSRFNLPRQTARAIASLVEERIFSMGMTAVPRSLIKQLVLGETAATLRAERELQTA